MRSGASVSRGGEEEPGRTGRWRQPPYLFRRSLFYDRRHFPAPRETFLHCWLSRPGSHALVDPGTDGGIAGYGAIRRCDNGYKIGPIFADTPEGADRLFRALVANAPDSPVFLDVPEPNREGLRLGEGFGMTPVFETARMYTREIPQLPLDRIYGITSFEMG
ncbi:MAG: hypothetical protein JXA08_01900 [Methanomicrobiaceae archaeon]|nr:hypothetical protein [Methanomicrobiaceae archaeon]